MDNLYKYVTFFKRSCNHKRKLNVHGVTRKGMRGITGCVFQEEKIMKETIGGEENNKSSNSERQPKVT